MSISFRGYHDSALTQEITSANPLAFTHVVGDSDSQDAIAYIGSNAVDKKLQASSNPGTDPCVVTVDDAGGTSPASEFKLAIGSGGLAAATPGAPLSLSATLYSGAGNFVPVYVRRTSVLNAAGGFTNVTLRIDSVVESPV